MQKHLYIFLLMIGLLFMTFFLDLFFQHHENIMTFQSYVVSQQKIPKELLKEYYHGEGSIKQKAAKDIMKATLKNLRYPQWLDYMDYIGLMIYESNILPGDALELIVVLNLSKDQSVIGVYRPVASEYIFSSKIENALPIEKLDFIAAPDLGYNFIISHQVIDERLGGFFIERFVKIYLYSGKAWKELWKMTKYSEEIYKLQWQDPKAPENQWIKITENNLIQFHQDPRLHISVEINRKKFTTYKETMPYPNEFKLTDTTRFKEDFYWNPQYGQFILKEGLRKSSGEPVAILEDTQHAIETFMGFSLSNYKIISSDGRIEYIPKDHILLQEP